MLNIHYISPSYLPSKAANAVHVIHQTAALSKLDLEISLYGARSTSKKNFSKDQLSSIFTSLLKNANIEKTRFSSENEISVNFNKNLKFNNLNIESKINLIN